MRRPQPGKHFLDKPQYQIDQHYDDDHSYNDTDGVPGHPSPPPLAPSLASYALTHAQNSAKAEIPEDPGPVGGEDVQSLVAWLGALARRGDDP